MVFRTVHADHSLSGKVSGKWMAFTSGTTPTKMGTMHSADCRDSSRKGTFLSFAKGSCKASRPSLSSITTAILQFWQMTASVLNARLRQPEAVRMCGILASLHHTERPFFSSALDSATTKSGFVADIAAMYTSTSLCSSPMSSNDTGGDSIRARWSASAGVSAAFSLSKPKSSELSSVTLALRVVPPRDITYPRHALMNRRGWSRCGNVPSPAADV
mmetsp:Transcript_8212/g.20970  ORF Transcript_8212/g.20970 Transcript_8212/m.20970 type:complete len:216 (-) Transcript_8212:302-949(-)